jgi:hypothetical protein
MRYRAVLWCLLLAPAALSAGGPDVAPALQLRQDGPSLTLQEAKALTPQALGDALLAPGHPPVTEAGVGPQGMEPPPPGAAVSTRVKLFLQPAPSEQPGFCQRTVATLYLEPGDAPKGMRPGHLATEIAYRWSGEAHAGSACSAAQYAFFIPRPGEERLALGAVRLLASASEAARQKRRIGYPLSLEDKEGPEMLAYERANPKEPTIPGWRIMTDAREALATLPIDAVTYAGPSSTAIPDILRPADLARGKNRCRARRSFSAAIGQSAL